MKQVFFKMKNRREPQIELYRTLCMFGVCLLHALDQGGFAGPHRGLDNLVTPSVVGFIFISGYFGIKLKWRHALNLLMNGFYCFTLVSTIGFLANGLDMVNTFRSAMEYGWFLWMYLALMLVAPLFEPLFAQSNHDNQFDKSVFVKVLPVMFLVFIWSYTATKIPVLKCYVPSVRGFGGSGLLTFVGVYLVARTCRYYQIERYLKSHNLALIALVSGAACWFNFMHYHSPFALLFAGSCFYLVRRIPPTPPQLSNFLILLAPSIFSVYLFHTNNIGFTWLRQFENYAIVQQGYNYYTVCLLVAIAAFLAGIVLDLPRRLVMAYLHSRNAR